MKALLKSSAATGALLNEIPEVVAARAKAAPHEARMRELDEEWHRRRQGGRRRPSVGTIVATIVAGAAMPVSALSDEELSQAISEHMDFMEGVRREVAEVVSQAAFDIAERERPQHRRLVRAVRDALLQLRDAMTAEAEYRLALSKRGGSTVGMPNLGGIARAIGLFGQDWMIDRAVRDAEQYLRD